MILRIGNSKLGLSLKRKKTGAGQKTTSIALTASVAKGQILINKAIALQIIKSGKHMKIGFLRRKQVLQKIN